MGAAFAALSAFEPEFVIQPHQIVLKFFNVFLVLHVPNVQTTAPFFLSLS